MVSGAQMFSLKENRSKSFKDFGGELHPQDAACKTPERIGN
jgi:hypothetical protein